VPFAPCVLCPFCVGASLLDKTARFHLHKQARHATLQPSRQTPRSTGSQHSTLLYNMPRPLYTQGTLNPGYREYSYPYPLTSGYGQSTGYRGAYLAPDYNRQPARPQLPPARQPLQITSGSDSARLPPTDPKPYEANPSGQPNRPGQQVRQQNLRPFQSRAFHGRAPLSMKPKSTIKIMGPQRCGQTRRTIITHYQHINSIIRFLITCRNHLDMLLCSLVLMPLSDSRELVQGLLYKAGNDHGDYPLVWCRMVTLGISLRQHQLIK